MTAPHSSSIDPSELVATEGWVNSRGTNLVTNGTGYFGDNTNFSRFAFDPVDAPVGVAGAFIAGSSFSQTWLDEIIPINPENRYVLAYQAKQKRPEGLAARHYSALVPVDAHGLEIQPYMYLHDPRTLTALARDLREGDTVIGLVSAAGWANAAGSNNHLRTIQFWNYVDPGGKVWGPSTYTRNYLPSAWVDGAIDFTTNMITLTSPYRGATVLAGTPVSNGQSGGQYIYPITEPVPGEWTQYRGRVAPGVAKVGVLASHYAGWPVGTAAAKVGFLPNYQAANSRHSFAAIEFYSLPDPTDFGDRSIPEAKVSPAVGSTAQRPTTATRTAGMMYFDTTLNRPIWWDGSKWINATGGTV